MRFLVDEQLPPALATWIQAEGHEAEHITDIGPTGVADHVLWDYALAHDAVLITKDQDFRDRLLQTTDAPVIVWIRLGNTRKVFLLSRFATRLPRIVELVEQGNRLIEVR